MNKHSKFNYIGIIIISSVIMITGTAGFLIPGTGRMSTATAYNIFHIAFGFLGFGILLWGNDRGIKIFNLSFGLIDLYQFVASQFGWFPESSFMWKPADDYAHLVIGIALVILGYVGLSRQIRIASTQD